MIVGVLVIAAAGIVFFTRMRQSAPGSPSASSSSSDAADGQTTASDEAPHHAPSHGDASPATASSLHFGNPSQAADRELSIPLELSSRHPVAEIRAEVEVPQGPWKFVLAEAPE